MCDLVGFDLGLFCFYGCVALCFFWCTVGVLFGIIVLCFGLPNSVGGIAGFWVMALVL